MTERRQTVAGAYAKIESHEELCAERYRGIHSALGGLQGEIRWATRAVWGVVLALVAWLALQLYTIQTDRLDHGPAAAAVSR